MHVKTSYFDGLNSDPPVCTRGRFYIGRDRSVVDFFKCIILMFTFLLDTLDISDEVQTDTKEIMGKGHERLGPPGIRMKTKHTKINRNVQPVDDV
jgi:hypothetical protein